MTQPVELTVSRERRADLDVSAALVRLVEGDALLGTGIDPDHFWWGLSAILREFAPENARLLAERHRLQERIDAFHRAAPGPPDPVAYREMLEEIGYLVPEPPEFRIATANVDDELARIAGPQLVVPVLNARFAVNAANARWGSLYDALYGTDALGDAAPAAAAAGYDPGRGQVVIARGRAFLDEIAPLTVGSHADATAYRVAGSGLRVDLGDGSRAGLRDPDSFVGHVGDAATPDVVLLRHHGLHAEIVIDRTGTIGTTDAAGIQDLVLESAVSTIIDLEDSVAAVDGEDKTLAYRNWLGLMRGTLHERMTKNGRTFERTMNSDRQYIGRDGTTVVLPGRALMLVRNVGLLMRTDAVLDANGEEVFEGILDAVMTALCALPDLRGASALRNSRTGSLYVVKPKLHGPEEVAFAVRTFERVEDLLGLPPRTIKVGIMDEERRTTVNLRACIEVAADRVVFINTGFLDRTGDEIHTSRLAGPVVPKTRMREQPFIGAYETANVDAGLRAGFDGRAQIGKGMWAMPDLMRAMLEQKVAHAASGASTAWVPSPTAAILHALHYHQVDVAARRRQLAQQHTDTLPDILTPPLASAPLDPGEVRTALDDSIQTILGYVVRWVDQGIGCSKVPDIHGVGLMEDRATLRISSQLLANWLLHEVISIGDVDASLHRIAPIVDAQNATDPQYEALLGDDGPGVAFRAARELIVAGGAQPNGYTEPILHRARRAKKAQRAG